MQMLNLRSRVGLPLIALLMLSCAGTGLAQEAGKKVGEKLDSVGRDIRSGLNRAGQEIKGQFAAAKSSVQNMSVEARVYSRLHWDKLLTDATIDLTTTEEGVITMTGSVASTKAKTLAAELAQGTVGVTKVIDKLAIQPAATTLPAGSRTSDR